MSGAASFAREVQDPGGARILRIVQGEHCVSADPAASIATILGSCVAVCLRDPKAGVGGMNHFLLPGDVDQRRLPGCDIECFGVHAMELLVNALLAAGAQRRNFEMKVFGGARTVRGLPDIGARNAACALDFARRERIPVVGECLGGTRGRRLEYWPVAGRARRVFLQASESARLRPQAVVPAPSGILELF